jgi:DNA-binding NarL/FixJ family response regulator
MLQVAILDDHAVVRVGLQRLLEGEPDMLVVGAAPTPTGLAARLDGRRVDVLVLDYDLADGDGIGYCWRIKTRPHPPRVLVYSAFISPALTIAARVAQADGIVDKAEPVATLLAAIRNVGHGRTALRAVAPDAYEGAVARLDDDDLPVFAMLADGETIDSIADTLRIDPAEAARRARRIIGRLKPRPLALA